jgi:prefoldin subunit 5
LQKQVNTIGNQLTKLRSYEDQIRSLPESRMSAEQKTETIKRIKESEDRMLMSVYKLRNMAGY